jgi:hypothetical protein
MMLLYRMAAFLIVQRFAWRPCGHLAPDESWYTPLNKDFKAIRPFPVEHLARPEDRGNGLPVGRLRLSFSIVQMATNSRPDDIVNVWSGLFDG